MNQQEIDEARKAIAERRRQLERDAERALWIGVAIIFGAPVVALVCIAVWRAL